MRRRPSLSAIAAIAAVLGAACSTGSNADQQFNQQQRSIQCSVMPTEHEAYDDWGCGDL